MPHPTTRRSARLGAAGLLLATVLGAQPARQVKDINATSVTPAFPTARPRAAAAALCFALDDGSSGLEIWGTDGTPAGTGLLHDIAPGPFGSGPAELTELNGQVYFTALGNELWVTDGTEAGTRLVKNLNPVFASFPGGLTAFDGRIYFVARDVDHGRELWASDGTAEGTQMIVDLWPGDFGSNPTDLTVIGDSLYFFGSEPDGTFGFYRLESGSGSPQLLRSFQPVVVPYGKYRETIGPGSLTAVGSTIFFVGTDPATGIELWKSDGTTAGTVLVKDIAAGALTVISGKLFFLSGSQLWMSDGTEGGTVPVSSAQPFGGVLILAAFRGSLIWTAFDPTQGSWVLLETDGAGVGTTSLAQFTKLGSDDAITVGDALYFSAGDAEHGVELWRTDGTASGTVLVKDLWPGPSDSQPSGLGEFQGRLYFLASDGRANSSLWTSDGTTEGTRIVRDIDMPGSYPSSFVPFGSRVFFSALDSSSSARRLWISDGTEEGTEELTQASVQSGLDFPSSPNLTVWQDRLYFSASDDAGVEPWTSDGTIAGTARLADIFPGSGSSFPAAFTPLGNRLLFFAQDPVERFQLWETDGTERGTTRITAIQNLNPGQFTLTPFGAVFLFSNNDFPESPGLWKTDGTSGGTVPIANVNFVRDLTPWNGAVYFSCNGGNGAQLCRTDGTSAGTVLLGPPGSSPTDLTAVEGTALFFVANGGMYGRTLWKTDGTEAGTVVVKQFAVVVSELTAVGKTLFFVVNDGIHGYELWRSDGTEPGTDLVVDILPGPGSSLPTGLTDIGGLLLVAASDGIHGAELWRSDGTPEGTFMIQDINPGPRSSNPNGFARVGDLIFFQADGGSSGAELWVLPVSALDDEPRHRLRSPRDVPFRR